MSADSERSQPGVMVVTDVYPPRCGGSGWSTHALVATLVSRGHPVRVVQLDPGSQDDAAREYDGVPVTVLGLARARRSMPRRFGAHDYSFAAVRDGVRQLLDDDREMRVVHGQHLHSAPGATAAAVDAGRAAVITVRDHWPVCLHGTAWWGGDECSGCTRTNLQGCMTENFDIPRAASTLLVPWARRRLATRVQDVASAHCVIAVSATLRQRLRARGAESEIDIIPNIVDPERSVAVAATAAAEDDPVAGLPRAYLFAAGKFSAGKGFEGMLEVLAAAQAPLPVVVAGTGEREDALRALARSLALDVHFLGWVEGPRLLRLMQAARAVIVPSLVEEALARVLLESMSVGTPVISWPVGSSREVIEHGVNGWIVNDAVGMREALAAIEDATRLSAVATAARRTAEERFAPAVVYPQIRAIYRRALEMAAQGSGGAISSPQTAS